MPVKSRDAQTGAVADQPRSIGAARLSSRLSGGTSVLQELHQHGSLKILFPRPEHRILEAVLLNISGGLTGGDRISLQASAGDASRMSVTTAAAERAYRVQPGSAANVSVTIGVAAGARLDWMPQETLLYDGCALHRRLDVALAGDARFLAVEPVVFGRAAMGEVLNRAEFSERWRIRRNGELIFADTFRVQGNVHLTLQRNGIATGAGAMANIVFAAPDAARHLGGLRELMPAAGGVSLIRPDVLTVRLLAGDSLALRKYLIPVMEELNGYSLPKVWKL